MRYLYPISLMLLLLASCGKDEEKTIERTETDWAFYKLNGDVKSISEKSYETFDGKTKGSTKHEVGSEHDRDLTFNEDGMLTTEKSWQGESKPFEEVQYKGRSHKQNHIQFVNGTPSIRTDYVWDKTGKNNLSVTRRNADNTPYDKVVMKYKNDKLIEQITYNRQDNPTDRITYIYDAKGNLKGKNIYMSQDIVQYKTEYVYNDKQQKIAEKQFDKNGKLDYETRFTYAGDKIVSSETSNADGDVTYVEKKTYDNKGNITSEYSFDKFDGKHIRDVYKYDTKGNKVGWEVYENDNLTMKAAYTFDKYGNTTKILVVDGAANVTDSRIYNYEYDDKGNWKRKLFIHNDRPMIITERSITYFE